MPAPAPPETVGPAAAASPSPAIPELLAPAGDWECARAAVENGADAIYFGLDRFNARMRARNFTEADLPGLMEFLHHRGVKGYVTFNTLVFTEEMPAAEEYLRSIIAAGVDAAIVQDMGVCRLIRRLSPDFPIHASTQMTVTSPAGVAFVKELGCDLVVLSRENSLREIQAIQDAAPGIPLEVFVHGALCVAYSGQCLTSESLGGRSANRGECAQACRMPYTLIADGKPVDLGDRHYLLSPQDLAGIELLPQLVRSGVRSLKIEGRLKSAEYVASITRVYRQALDRLAARPGSAELAPVPRAVSGQDRYELEMAFSRGLHTGWFEGIDNQRLVHARFAKKRGVYLGEITRVRGQSVVARLQAPLKPGDGVVIDTGTGDDREQGGRVFSLHPFDGGTQISFRAGQIDPGRVHPGDKLWKTDDPALDKEIRRTFEGEAIRHRRPVVFECHGHAGTSLTVIARDGEGHVVEARSRTHLVLAQQRPLGVEVLTDQLGRLGGTPYRLGGIRSHLGDGVHIAISELNQIRRDVVERLDTLRKAPKRWTLNATAPRQEARPARVFSLPPAREAAGPGRPVELIVLVRSLEQLDAAVKCGAETVYCDFEDPKKYREAVHQFHAATSCDRTGRTIWLAPPRITKPGEEWILKQVASACPDGYLVRNYDQLRFFAGARRRADFSWNVANPLAAEHLIEGCGVERVTASYDLSAAQLESLLLAGRPEWYEVTLHQHMPMFHMEHCVFCAFLSKGTDYRNCGRPCDTREVRLRDRVGMEHPLKADAGCRNTLFNARAQTGAESYERLVQAGARAVRIEFVQEKAVEVEQTMACYRQLIRGELAGAEVWRKLNVGNQLGVTRGQLVGNEARKVFPKA